MRIYKVYFKCMYPVGCGLIITAPDMASAEIIADETLFHTKYERIEEIKLDKPKVIFYASGDY